MWTPPDMCGVTYTVPSLEYPFLHLALLSQFIINYILFQACLGHAKSTSTSTSTSTSSSSSSSSSSSMSPPPCSQDSTTSTVDGKHSTYVLTRYYSCYIFAFFFVGSRVDFFLLFLFLFLVLESEKQCNELSWRRYLLRCLIPSCNVVWFFSLAYSPIKIISKRSKLNESCIWQFHSTEILCSLDLELHFSSSLLYLYIIEHFKAMELSHIYLG